MFSGNVVAKGNILQTNQLSVYDQSMTNEKSGSDSRPTSNRVRLSGGTGGVEKYSVIRFC